MKIKIPKIKVKGSKVLIPKKYDVFTVTSKFRKVFSIVRAFYKEARKHEDKNGEIPTKILEPLKRKAAQDLLKLTNIKLHTTGKPDHSRPVIFVGNHLSYIDIPVLVAAAPVVFVAKKEIKKWPVIGKAARYAGTVFVKRSSKKSRSKTLEAIEDCLIRRKQSVAVFPAGTTSLTEHIPWRWGSFEIAKELKVPVQPFRLTFKPLRKATYIDDDTFMTHLWVLLLQEKIEIFIEFGEPFFVKDPQKDAERMWKWSQGIFKKHPSEG